MISEQKIPKLKEHIELLKTQLTLLGNKIQGSNELEPDDNTQEEERAKILGVLEGQRKSMDSLLTEVEQRIPKNGDNPLTQEERLKGLLKVNSVLMGVIKDTNELSKKHDECNLELYRQEVSKAAELCLETFDFVLPNIRYEIEFLEKFYRLPANISDSVLPEVSALKDKLENHKISLDQFLTGYLKGTKAIAGYMELRARRNAYPMFQHFDNSFEAYNEANTCYYEFCTTMEPLLKEKKGEADFEHFLNLVKNRNRPIQRMSDLFQAELFLENLFKITSRKYSYSQEVKKARPLLERFRELKNKLLVYHEDEIEQRISGLEKIFQDDPSKKRFQAIIDEVREAIKNKTLPFDRLEKILDKLEGRDFNIVVTEKDASDITITITPHHEKKFGRELLERINNIIMEIDFWYPPDAKQGLFQDLGHTTDKIQKDEPVDKNDFLKLMQRYDKEIEANIRKTYEDRIRELKNIYGAYQKLFQPAGAKEKLAERLLYPELWQDIDERMEKAGQALKVLSSNDESMKKNVNKFPFLKMATENISQVLYDLSMRLFVLFPGGDEKYVANMTNILSTFNEFHDVGPLWAGFSYFHKKLAIPNFPVVETMMIETAKNPLAKAQLKELFPPESKTSQK